VSEKYYPGKDRKISLTDFSWLSDYPSLKHYSENQHDGSVSHMIRSEISTGDFDMLFLSSILIMDLFVEEPG